MGRAAKKIDWDKAQEILKSLEKQGHQRGLMAVALGTMSAYRCSDWSKLKWGDITDKIRVKEQKTGKIREVPVHPELRRIVELCKGPDDDYIFMPLRGGTGKPLATGGAIKMLKAIGEAHGIPDLTTHSLRKCAAWRIYEQNGKNDHALTILSIMLNHQNTATTRVYLGITAAEIENIYLNM